MDQSESFIVTVTLATTGEMELLDASNVKTIHDLAEWTSMLFDVPSNIHLFKDGALLDASHTLQQAGVSNGDLLLVVTQTAQRIGRPQASQPSQALDFSTLLNQSASARTPTPTNSGDLNFSTLLSGAVQDEPTRPFVYPGDAISLDDAIRYNPHPRAFAELLLSNESLFKEFNYHHPILAEKMRNKSVDQAADIWRDAVTKGSIEAAFAHTERRQKEQTMRNRLLANPHDEEAHLFFEQTKNQTLIHEQYRNVMENYPESMGKILMLYIDTHVNGVAVQSFVDSGAQSTIMTRQCAQVCGIAHLIDTRFEGQAVGVGTGIILGRIHLVEMKIGTAHFPITITVMEKMSSNNDMKFLLGLDNLKRFACQIDLEKNVLRFKLGPGKFMSTPFLSEKDLDEEKGGTKGFDAERANRELMEARKKQKGEGDISRGEK